MDAFFDHSRHDEMMRIFAPSAVPQSSTVVPQSSTVVPQSSTSDFFNIHNDINSDNDCDLPHNEDAVDLFKYLDCSEAVTCNDLPSSVLTPAQIRHDEPTIPLSQLLTVLHSSEMNNDWMPNVKRETEKSAFNCWIPKRETEDDELTKGLDFHLCSSSEFDMTDPEIGIDIATGNDSDVGTESDETATDASISTDMFDATVPSTSAASTSSSTKAKKKMVYSAGVISMPRPRGRPRGSKKKQQSARTGHASISKNTASLPSCSKSKAENSTASNPVVLGRGVFDHSRHDEMMRSFAPSVVPQSSTVVPQSSTSDLFNIHDHINSDIDCDLPDNEDAVDLLKYLDCSEDIICNDLPSSVLTPAQIRHDEGLDLHLCSPSEFDMTDPEFGIDIATGNDSDVDVEPVETAKDALCSTDMFDATVSSTFTASTSSSTKAKNKGVYTARWISTPRPQGRPRGRPPGSKKKQQSARTGQATTSKRSSLPACSKSETENSTASNPVVLGRKRKLVKDDKTQSQPTYIQVQSTSITTNCHDYAFNPTASPFTTETARSTVVSKRNYRRNTVAVVDKEKQNHHNQLERNRRQKLADLFNSLRDEVPKISCNPKASKVSILNEAGFHILDLENTNKLQEEEASKLSQDQTLLKIQLQQLQSKISGRVK